MKKILCAIAALAALLGSTAALAQAFPAKPVRIVVPFAAGGAIDIIVRASAQQLAKELGQPMVIDNRPGASGNIGAELVAKSAATAIPWLPALPLPTPSINPSTPNCPTTYGATSSPSRISRACRTSWS